MQGYIIFTSELIIVLAQYRSRAAGQAVADMQEDEEVGGEGQWGDLVQPRYRRMMVLAVTLPLLQQASGINSITFYSSSVSPIFSVWCRRWTAQTLSWLGCICSLLCVQSLIVLQAFSATMYLNTMTRMAG